jgi:hypothetical protein
MEQIFGFQFSKEVYVRPCKVQANKDGEVTHFVIQIRHTASIVPNGCFQLRLISTVAFFVRTYTHIQL